MTRTVLFTAVQDWVIEVGLGLGWGVEYLIHVLLCSILVSNKVVQSPKGAIPTASQPSKSRRHRNALSHTKRYSGGVSQNAPVKKRKGRK